MALTAPWCSPPYCWWMNASCRSRASGAVSIASARKSAVAWSGWRAARRKDSGSDSSIACAWSTCSVPGLATSPATAAGASAIAPSNGPPRRAAGCAACAASSSAIARASPMRRRTSSNSDGWKRGSISRMRSTSGGWVAKARPMPSREQQVRDFLGVGIHEAGTGAERADLHQRVPEALRVARELDGGGVGQRFAVTRDRGLDQPPEEEADPAEREHDQRRDEDDRNASPAFASAAAAARRQAQDRARDHRDHGEPEQQADQARAEAHVAVQHVAELVGDHALQLVAIEVHERAAGDRDRRVRRAVARRECVDPRLALEHVDLRHRHAGGDRHLLDDVAQPAA